MAQGYTQDNDTWQTLWGAHARMMQHLRTELNQQLESDQHQQGGGDETDADAKQRQHERDEYQRAYLEQRRREFAIWEKRINRTTGRQKRTC